MNIKDIVENPHPIHTRYVASWKFYLESYEGGIDYTKADLVEADDKHDPVKVYINGKEATSSMARANLFMHSKERMDDYIKRIKQSYYYNYCAPVVDIYTNHIFKNPVVDNLVDSQLAPVIENRRDNIDLRGNSITEMRKLLADYAQILGHCYVVVDMPKMQQENSLADKISNNRFPYIKIYLPQDIINWSLDPFGKPYWVLGRECLDANSDPFNFDKNDKGKIVYRLWTRDEWFLFDEKFELIEEGLHKLGVVPIEPVYNKQSLKYTAFMGVSELIDIAFISRDIYNCCSELRQILRDQTFAFLAFQGKSTDYDDITLATHKGLVYPEGMNPPQYVSPPSQNAEVYQKHIENQIGKIYQLAKLSGGAAHQEEQIVSQSGVSKAFDFHETNSALAKKASMLEDAETGIWKIVSLWEGKEFDGYVKYPSDFSITSLMEDLSEAEQIAKMNLGKMVLLETKKAIIKKKFPRLPDEEIEKMYEDLEGQINIDETNNKPRLSIFDRLNLNQKGTKQGEEK
jgi:hypothetical protein